MPGTFKGLSGLLGPVLGPVRLRADTDELKVAVDVAGFLDPYCIKLSQVVLGDYLVGLCVSVLD